MLAVGCAAPLAPNIVRYPQFNYPPTDAKAVTIYKEPPPAQYEAIGEVRTRIPANAPMDQFEQALREEAAKIGANGVVMVVQDRVTEQKIQRPVMGAQQPVGASSTPGGGVATLPAQTGRMEEVTIRVHEKEITGVVIRFKK
ncbi:MAG: hypothetical protein HY215_04730 [Candidatus Rokubacteria bacterium]|nr:hypothetical protein [Candidatus Rokubacteria bacterium]